MTLVERMRAAATDCFYGLAMIFHSMGLFEVPTETIITAPAPQSGEDVLDTIAAVTFARKRTMIGNVKPDGTIEVQK